MYFYQLFADMVLLLHASFVIFVVFGGWLCLDGGALPGSIFLQHFGELS